MSLNKALQAMLHQYGRPVRYPADHQTVVTTALITPCKGGVQNGITADLTGIPQDNRYVYISVSQSAPPAAGVRVRSGGREYVTERSGTAAAGAMDYSWALLCLDEDYAEI